VARCEKDGLISRVRDPDDGRAFRISLTARGRRLRRAAEATLAEIDDEIVAILGARKRDALIEALKGVMDL
jgi:MarR family transcriptional regulator, lower aerobic nicotinate degradation pathway regulator